MENVAHFWRESRIPTESWPVVVMTLRLLQESRRFADGTANEPRTFALRLNQFLAEGSNGNILRLLMGMGLVEHLIETTRPLAKRRRFRAADSMSFEERSCFVLADKGLAKAEAILAAGAESHGANREAMSNGMGSAEPPLTPRWEPGPGRLWAGRLLLHHFPRQAINLRLLLAAWQEDNWEEWLDNPLPEGAPGNAAKHLLDAMHGLNCCQSPKLLRFHFETRDGSEGAWWEWESNRCKTDHKR
jgi:hypothetical protein